MTAPDSWPLIKRQRTPLLNDSWLSFWFLFQVSVFLYLSMRKRGWDILLLIEGSIFVQRIDIEQERSETLSPKKVKAQVFCMTIQTNLRRITDKEAFYCAMIFFILFYIPSMSRSVMIASPPSPSPFRATLRTELWMF